MADVAQRPARVWMQFLLAAWIMGAQIFYFHQFSPAIGSLLRALPHRLWP
jgi:hypothetical protein